MGAYFAEHFSTITMTSNNATKILHHGDTVLQGNHWRKHLPECSTLLPHNNQEAGKCVGLAESFR